MRKADIILISALIIFAVMFIFIFNFSTTTGNTAVIKLNGEIYAEVSLSEDKDIEVYNNEMPVNTIRIQNNTAFMVFANCPDKLCVKHKPIGVNSRINDIIACLPNRVTVEIKSGNQSKDFDIIIGN